MGKKGKGGNPLINPGWQVYNPGSSYGTAKHGGDVVGPGKAKKPKGLYRGKAGDFAAQSQPQNYLNALLMRSGYMHTGGPSAYQAFLSGPLFQNLYAGYTGALSGNERLKWGKFLGYQLGAPELRAKKAADLPNSAKDYAPMMQRINAMYNVMTPAQKAEQGLQAPLNPYIAGQGRVSYW